MKNQLFVLTAIFAMVFSVKTVQAQSVLPTAIADVTLSCQGGGSSRTGIAYNPNQQLYYSVNGGSNIYPIETFSSTGTRLAGISQGFDYRGVWWNPNTGVIEGNGYNTLGIWVQNLDANFYALGTGTNVITNVSGPDQQSTAHYDYNADEILYYNNGNIYRYLRSDHSLISTTAITGLPVPTSNLNSYSIAYTGITGMEIGVYDYTNRRFYFINKANGAYVTASQLPPNAPNPSQFQTGYANNRLWLYDYNTREWKSYIVVSGCQNNTGSETYTGCQNDGYSVTVNGTTYNEANPSGTETLTNVAGCDSVVTINLTFNAPNTGSETYTGCQNDGYSVTVNGTTYNEANPSGTETLTNVAGCDSVVTINLTFNAPNTGSETYIGCQNDGYSVTVNGTTYNEVNPSGTETLTNVAGCDSVVTINLTFNSVNVSTSLSGLTITADLSGATYQWINCADNTPISGETNQSFTAIVNGNYAVIINDGNCSDTSSCSTINNVGIDEKVISFSIYPNPTSGMMTIETNEIVQLIEIYSTKGKKVASFDTKEFNISSLKSGIYFVKVSSESGVSTSKIIKK